MQTLYLKCKNQDQIHHPITEITPNLIDGRFS